MLLQLNDGYKSLPRLLWQQSRLLVTSLCRTVSVLSTLPLPLRLLRPEFRPV
jgi:hypothetical protein